MVSSEIKTYTYSDGEICRVQIVRGESWEQAEFVRPPYDPASFDGICHIYRSFLVPAAPYVFGKLRMVHAADRETDDRAAADRTKTADSSEQVVKGLLPFTKTIPIGHAMGKLTQLPDKTGAAANSSFFIMDPFDCASKYDIVGTPFGLTVKDGTVMSPPLFGREALMVYDDGTVKIEEPKLSGMGIMISGLKYVQGKNAEIYERPVCARTGRMLGGRKSDIVIIGDKVVDVRTGGHTEVPASGFVLRVRLPHPIGVGDTVRYLGMENITFAVQVGNSIMRDGVRTDRFISTFYNVKKPWTTEYPPSLYPLDFEHARAARIILGADAGNKPVLLWAEGAGKCGYEKGRESAGASLKELADICEDLKLKNAINLDGGGSAQILVDGVRSLKISDRCPDDNSETERAVPIAIVLR